MAGINFSIISGWFPTVVIIVAIAATVLAIGWTDRAWRLQLLVGIPVSLILTALVGVAVHVFDLVPAAFPRYFYVWTWLFLFSLVVAVLGWRQAHWAQRGISVVAMVFTFVAAFTVVNQTYDYWPTLDRLLGKEAAHLVDLPELNAIRAQVRATGHLPDHGDTIVVHVPPTRSKFDAQDAYVWLPPAWFKSPEPALPVIELIAGVPGSPSDWTRAAYADTTSTDFAEHHDGLSPILVMPDANGNAVDTECDNSHLGQAETYLSVDVPAFMRAEFNAATGRHSLAVGGLSAGGTCSVVLALRNPTIYTAFSDFSGQAHQTFYVDDRAQTIHDLFEGSLSAYLAHDPPTLLKARQYPTVGWFSSGLEDPGLGDARQLAALARDSLAQTCFVSTTGGHDYAYWEVAFRQALPWLSWHLGLTAPPSSSPAHCEPPIP